MFAKPLNVYIGYDSKEDTAYNVCARSMLDHASCPLNIVRLDQDWLFRIGLYRRQSFTRDSGQRYDTIDCMPYSTEFSFTRFLVPCLQPDGMAVFCDSDFLWRDDICNMMVDIDEWHAVSVVKHQFVPKRSMKMRGLIQEPYPRKNWSSLMVWNCDHRSTKMLTPYQVNYMAGSWLHGLKWLDANEIGAIEEKWNWLEGHSSPEIEPSAVHFTRGTPDMPGHQHASFAEEWNEISAR